MLNRLHTEREELCEEILKDDTEDHRKIRQTRLRKVDDALVLLDSGKGRNKMKANVFLRKNNIRVEEVDKPRAGVGGAVIRVTLTTICGTDSYIVRGEHPVAPGLADRSLNRLA